MLKRIKHIWYGLPMQLLMLHCKRFQVFLIFWYVLFATITGNFMKAYGADSLFLAPEYFNRVSPASVAIVGFALGVFIMSWNITTFILNGHFVSFLATNAQPFLKYCINNSLLPLIFIVAYISKSIVFERFQELQNGWEIALQTLSFLGGLVLAVLISFGYFFGADKTIYHKIKNNIDTANDNYKTHDSPDFVFQKHYIKVAWFYSARLNYRLPRDMKYYDEVLIKKILSRHHFAAVIAIVIAFVFLIAVGFVNDNKLFQLPAAASILIFFALLISASGAFSIFFRKWSLMVLVCLYLGINFLYKKEIVDPRNKAYGLDYTNKDKRPMYDESTVNVLASNDSMELDKKIYLDILNKWKAKQSDSLPVLYIVNTSGGGLRSATFAMNVLQEIDKEMNGQLMNKTLFITGASGGVLGATYFRELALQNKNPQDKIWIDKISTDLLNPLFSSFISRDIIGPVLKFNYAGKHYVKDRGYAFEQKLNENTDSILDKKISDYKIIEQEAKAPFMLFSSVITRDARKMIIASNSVRFLMKPANVNVDATGIDAIDFTSYFKNEDAGDLKLISALRMNATFPYALPNVWLPTEPVIDVMDAGIRDNYGTETTLRFLTVFKDWMDKNVSRIVVLHIRDRALNDWEKPTENNDYLSFLIHPLASIQNNMFNLQDYSHASQVTYAANGFNGKFQSICWQYIPENFKKSARLSFHLTATEKRSIVQSVHSALNETAFKKLRETIGKN